MGSTYDTDRNEDGGVMRRIPSFTELTTIGVGGAPRQLREPTATGELVEVAREVWGSGEDWLLIAGGSNTVVADDGFDGTAIRIATRGISVVAPERAGSSTVILRAEAGEPWDAFVAYAVRSGLSGIEALSGIPGSVGAAPVQNIGAYGQELADILVAVEFLDAETGDVRRVPAGELGLGYRTSALKRGMRGIVLAVEVSLTDVTEPIGAPLSSPVAYAQLADFLGVPVGSRVTLPELRRAVLALRASKGMLLDPDDPDSASAGSFFTNPIVTENFARALPGSAPRWPIGPDEPDVVTALRDRPADLGDTRSAHDGPQAADAGPGTGATPGATPAHASGAGASVAVPGTDAVPGRVSGADMVPAYASGADPAPYLAKLSAAWLIEQSGIRRGFALPGSRAAISTKHTLAITNRGGATAAEIAQLATFVQSRVQSEFGVILQPEPVLVGLIL